MKRRVQGIAACCALALLWSAPAGARQLPVRVLTSMQGLPRNAVSCLIAGPSGVMWACTSEGLARFDGNQFRVFGPEQGLPSRVVLDFMLSKNGGYWVTTDMGVCRLPANSRIGDPCRVIPVDRAEGEFGGVLETSGGATWVATNRALYRLSDDGRILQHQALRLGIEHNIQALAEAPDGQLLVGSEFGLYAWKSGPTARNLTGAIEIMGIQDILRLSPAEFLIGTNRGLYRMDAKTFGLRLVPLPPLEDKAYVHQILRRHDGSVWVSVASDICRIAQDPSGEFHVTERYTLNDGLPFRVHALVEDAQGNLWGTTDAAGIFRILDSGVVSYNERDGLENTAIGSIFEDRLGRICVMTSKGSTPALRVQDGDVFRPATVPYPRSIRYFGWGWNQMTFHARNGEWWFPTGEGVLRFAKTARAEDLVRAAPPRLYGKESPLGCTDIFRLFEDSSSDVWITCLGPSKLTRWERATGRFHVWGAADGWPAGAIAYVIREGPKGEFWIGTDDSVVRFRDSRFETFPIGYGPRLAMVGDLLVDHAGRVWVATRRCGLFRCDNPQAARPVFRNYTVQEGLSSNSVRSVIEDEAGLIYAGTVRAVDRIDPQAPLEARHIRHFTPADGLPDSEHTAAFHDSHGRLWFGTMRGLARFTPPKTPPPPPPNVYLTRVRVRGQDVPLPWEGAQSIALQLAPDRNQMEVEYAAVDQRSVASIRYQYRIVGVDSRWSEPQESRTVNYASLPYGSLRFEVRAVDYDGRLSPTAAAVDLFIDTPVWRRWWFLLSAFGLAAAIVVAVYNYRVRHLLAIERLRTRIATDLHDDIGASLSQISILSEVARRGNSPLVLGDIAEMAREMVQEMSDIVWAVNPRHDALDALAHRMRRFASDTLGGANIELSFDAEEVRGEYAPSLENRRTLYLVFKEAVNNAARHSGAARVTIRLHLAGPALKLTVEDDGTGFDPEKQYAGEGVASIARRMESAGGSAVWESAAGQGTLFTATLPLGRGKSLSELMAWLRRRLG